MGRTLQEIQKGWEMRCRISKGVAVQYYRPCPIIIHVFMPGDYVPAAGPLIYFLPGGLCQNGPWKRLQLDQTEVPQPRRKILIIGLLYVHIVRIFGISGHQFPSRHAGRDCANPALGRHGQRKAVWYFMAFHVCAGCIILAMPTAFHLGMASASGTRATVIIMDVALCWPIEVSREDYLRAGEIHVMKFVSCTLL